MHLWCFVLACKKTGYWTRRAVLIIASEAEEYADPHTKTHTKKKQVLLVVVLWFHPVGCLCQMRDTTNCPVAFFLHFARSIAFFFALCPSHRFFFTLCRSHRFFLHCVCHIAFFLHFARSIAFFYTLPVTSLFFALCLSHRIFFAIWWLLRFFLQSPVPMAFFLQRKIGDPSVAFFLQDVSASLDCCNSGCISVCTFAFILHFFAFFPYFFTL